MHEGKKLFLRSLLSPAWQNGLCQRASEPKIPLAPCKLCMGSDGVLDCATGIGTGSGSVPYGKSRAAQMIQPWVLHHGPRTPGVSPADQVSQLSRGFLVQVVLG